MPAVRQFGGILGLLHLSRTDVPSATGRLRGQLAQLPDSGELDGAVTDDLLAIAYEPVDQPYGYLEYSARDLEAGLWSFMQPLD